MNLRLIACVTFLGLLPALGAVAQPSIEITSISPVAGPVAGGIEVVIGGEGFSLTGTTRVLFGLVEATDVEVSPAGYNIFTIQCTLPPNLAGVVDVTVIHPDGRSEVAEDAFEYEAEPIFVITPSNYFPEADARFELVAPPGTTHQWFKDGAILEDDLPRISGTQAQTLQLDPLQPSDEGVYTCQYNDGSKAILITPPYELEVLPPNSLPVNSTWTTLLLATLLTVGVPFALLKRKRSAASRAN